MYLFPAYLQGDVAIPSIIEQLKKIEKVKHHFDVVVIVRGGGGEVGLSCYNNYELCKSIAQFPLPILTGIGHSTNLTVAEMVAFRNAITPTELADFLIGSFQEIDLYLRESQRSIISVTKNIIERSKSGLTSEVKLFKNVTQKRLMETKNTLVSTSSSMKSGVKLRMQKEQEFISNSHISIKRSVKELVSQQNTGLKTYNERISKGANYLFKEQRNDLNSIVDQLPKLTQFFVQKNSTILTQLEQTIRLIDPINVLKRGYSIALIEGKIISENNPVEPGKTMVVKTHQYEIETEIKKIKEL
jgi:exodeoxyribonuclease VII large subunit